MTRLPRLVYLQYVRALAAFAVVFYHLVRFSKSMTRKNGKSL